ncbi:MAG: flagellar biosynthesis anti-sigma factor FlgM [Pseudohongiella sp.]|nr:flagellar biosynthesis anti-sigma factor FlgM [Pseudohongiella sp.]MDO9521654.1 flagellar biosynthesis anti-sigma factor FlgM [Pseudohongiella sp.]MDP2127881.1 flagellar biosynthesis anti-sigma factor FlgM [Pseudohongiella sp.]
MSIPTISNSTPAPDSRGTVRSSSGQTSATGAGSSNRASSQQAGTPQTNVDAVSISSQAVDLQALESSIRQLPEVNAARVTELRDQISAGQYNVDSQRVADKILAFEQKF